MKEFSYQFIAVSDKDVQVFLLPIADNLKSIDEGIIPEIQRRDIYSHRYRFDIDKRLLARCFCYRFMKNHYGVNNFELDFNQFKKPFLKYASDICFNFSYSNEYTLVAISYKKKIGIDIEYMNPVLPIGQIAHEIMCSEELSRFSLYGTDVKTQLFFFFNLFTAKESIVKAFGTGLYLDPKKLNTIPGYTYVHDHLSYIQSEISGLIKDYSLSMCIEQ
jgi:phosphopantetheinyl transferase